MPKLKLFQYNKKSAKIFRKQRERLIKLLGNQEIHHIGSTAVPGLGGKGIIDIMIALEDWEERKEIIKRLKTTGFTYIRPRDKGRVFISQPGETKYSGTHIHLVKRGKREYKNLLFFRDFLRKHGKDAQEYGLQKMRLLDQAQGNRAVYKKLKEKYIKSILKHAA